jgi:photosystem II stability/assembly factor-like uncharacterized protein
MKNHFVRTGRLVSLALAFILSINWTVLPVCAHSVGVPVEPLMNTTTSIATSAHLNKGHVAPEHLRQQFNNLPLRFEAATLPNTSARFLARSGALGFELTASTVRIALPTAGATDARLSTQDSLPRKLTPAFIGWQLVGAKRRAAVCGEDHLPVRTSYLIGNDAARWRTDVASFSRVRVEQIYRGVDVVYYGSGNALEYDFRLAPRADVKAIRLRFNGARVRVDEAGDLVIETPAGQLRQHKPMAYQLVNDTRTTVEAHFVIDHSGDVRFRVGAYDKRRSLVIDPVLSYATYFGSPSTGDAIMAVATDGAGNAYLAGSTMAADFPTTPGALQSLSRNYDGFIAKFNPEGTALVYATYFGGAAFDSVSDIAVDAAGNAYITGGTASLDLPTTAQAFQPTAPDNSGHAFIAKLNPTGTALIYSTYLASTVENTAGISIAISAAGEATVAGQTNSPRLPVTAGALQTTFGGSYDVFVARLSHDGSKLIFATFLGGDADDTVRGLALDASGNVYVAGETSSSNFPTTPHAYRKKKKMDSVNFITKINSTGDGLGYSTFLNSDGRVFLWDIAVDSYGNAYLTGDAVTPGLETTPGALQPTFAGGGDAFVTKLNAAGTGLIYSTFIGGSEGESGRGIAVDSVGQAYIVGATTSADFPLVKPLQSHRAGAPLYKSTDGGNSWNDIAVPLRYFESMAIDPQTSTTLYASYGDLLKSTDGGATWQILARNISGKILIDPIDSATIYVYGGSALNKSTNAGATWERTQFATPPGLGAFPILSTLVIDPKAHQTLYLASTLAISVPDPITIQALAPLPEGRLLKSTDGGASWTALDLRLASDEGVNCVAIDPQVPSTIYANATRIGLLKSIDGGASWFNPNLTTTFSVSQLIVDPTDSATLYGLANGNIVKSTNSGGSWSPLILPSSPINTPMLSPQSPSTLYASGFEAIYKTTDGGASWSPVLAGAAASLIALDPQQPSTIYARGGIGSDIFVAKLNAAGTALVYSTYLGTRGPDGGRSIAVDERGNAFVIGQAASSGFATTPGAYLSQSTKPNMGVLVRINDVTALRITQVEVKGKKLLVSGEGFDQGAIIVADSTDLPTMNDSTSPASLLISARGGKQIPRGQTTAIRVRNADGHVSEPFNFTRGSE